MLVKAVNLRLPRLVLWQTRCRRRHSVAIEFRSRQSHKHRHSHVETNKQRHFDQLAIVEMVFAVRKYVVTYVGSAD